MVRSTIAITVLALAAAAAAQQGRYRDFVFARANVQPDVAYGQAVNRFTQQTETLELDLYTPRGDTATARAAIVLVHGGGFVGGDKGSQQWRTLGDDFARRGYVAISINYRLVPSGSATPQAITDASHDMKAAVRWLRRNASTLRLDPQRIGCLGGSAGAITCAETAYVPGEGSSGNPGFSSEVGAVIDLWGLLADLTQLEAGEAPVQIIHGTDDPTVLYQNALDLKARADAVGVPAELFPIQGAGHGPWGAYFGQYHVEAVGFLYHHLGLGQLAGLQARPGYASPGRLTLDSFGIAGDSYAIMVAAAQTSAPVPGFGTLCLDPLSGLVVATAGTLPSAPRLATASRSMAVPPGVVGDAYWQAFHLESAASGRWLTNCVTTTF